MKVWYRLLGGWHETEVYEINLNTKQITLNNGMKVSIKDLNSRWTIHNPYKKKRVK